MEYPPLFIRRAPRSTSLLYWLSSKKIKIGMPRKGYQLVKEMKTLYIKQKLRLQKVWINCKIKKAKFQNVYATYNSWLVDMGLCLWVSTLFSQDLLILGNVCRFLVVDKLTLENALDLRKLRPNFKMCVDKTGWLKKFLEARENREVNFQNVYAANDSWLVDMGLS